MTAGVRQDPLPERLAVLERSFRGDLTFWIGTRPRTALRLMELMEAVLRDPFTGIGKPELLKHGYHGHWSRRLTDEDRLIYRVTDVQVLFVVARKHYAR